MAKWEKGQSGNAAGRKKGSKNKLSYKKDVWEACVKASVDPFLVLAQIAAGTLKTPEGVPENISASLRKEAAAELCVYLKPKLKSVELNNTGGGIVMMLDGIAFDPAPAADAVDDDDDSEDD